TTIGIPQLGGHCCRRKADMRRTSGPASTPSSQSAPPVPTPPVASPRSRSHTPSPSMFGSSQPSSRHLLLFHLNLPTPHGHLHFLSYIPQLLRKLKISIDSQSSRLEILKPFETHWCD
ncbi:hypothetical protein PTTG_28917, partial [Puccinia triticina 1-1 BBBD Race 1]